MSDRVSVTHHDDEVVVSHQAFPCLTADQVEQIAQIAERRRFGDGELLWRIGDRRIPLHVILEGAVDIRQRRANGDSRLIVRHGRRQFGRSGGRLSVPARRACACVHPLGQPGPFHYRAT